MSSDVGVQDFAVQALVAIRERAQHRGARLPAQQPSWTG